MIAVNIELVGTLQRRLGKKRLTVNLDEPRTVLMLAQRLSIIKPSIVASIDEEMIDPSILILVNGKEISILNGLNTILENGALVTFVPVSHGG